MQRDDSEGAEGSVSASVFVDALNASSAHADSGFYTFVEHLLLKGDHKSYLTRKTHKARVTETRSRLYLFKVREKR